MNSIWKSDYTKEVISYVHQTYGDETEMTYKMITMKEAKAIFETDGEVESDSL